ncbi:MAG: hypothetical protein U0236_21300 [Nitrospira sp.]
MPAGVLNKVGSSAGSVVPVTLITTPVLPTAQRAYVTEFAVSMGPGSTNGLFILQMSNDGFALNIVEKYRIAMPSPGSFVVTFDSGLLIPSGYAARVIFSQGVAGVAGGTISGSTERTDDTSLPGTDIIDM